VDCLRSAWEHKAAYFGIWVRIAPEQKEAVRNALAAYKEFNVDIVVSSGIPDHTGEHVTFVRTDSDETSRKMSHLAERYVWNAVLAGVSFAVDRGSQLRASKSKPLAIREFQPPRAHESRHRRAPVLSIPRPHASGAVSHG
jgi:hypothetical protein